MLQNCLSLVLLDRLGHHVKNGVHDSRTELKIEVRLHTLFRDSLGNTLAISAFELTGEEIAKPERTR